MGTRRCLNSILGASWRWRILLIALVTGTWLIHLSLEGLWNLHGHEGSTENKKQAEQYQNYESSEMQKKTSHEYKSNTSTVTPYSGKGNVVDKMEEAANRNRERINHARMACSRHNTTRPSGLGGYIYEYAPKKLFYCAIPKIGCTFWIRIFKFLNGFKKGNVSSPFMIDRHAVHKNVKKRPRPDFWSSLPVASFSFMFARDPYTRLFSAYIDKLFLPNFWSKFGKEIIRKYREKPSSESRRCGNDVTFKEFITYVTDTNYEPHWTPMTKQCNPCYANFTVIGKQETFLDDAQYILGALGLRHLIDNFTFGSFVEGELRTLTKYNFRENTQLPSTCRNEDSLAQRLWSSYQMNGFLDENTEFPNSKKSVDETGFLNMVLSEYQRNPIRKEQMKIQKRNALVNAYRKLPSELLNKLKRKFKWDFDIFKYDDSPSDIYH